MEAEVVVAEEVVAEEVVAEEVVLIRSLPWGSVVPVVRVPSVVRAAPVGCASVP
ncbi:hypothetical protein Scani_75200 [Streptomyces caniferus]|uniref:Uncharacterized protein n=1 Tax=Streptomyces caniferus TaxID=285557 RepID=A0A640SKI9_9ACTN|nr:hypothetical protein Scani_75200 [Streptomyces caniferus]